MSDLRLSLTNGLNRKKYPKQDLLAFGVMAYLWEESAIYLSFAWWSVGVLWRRNRPPAKTFLERFDRFMNDPSFGLCLSRSEGYWDITVGPWTWPSVAPSAQKGR